MRLFAAIGEDGKLITHFGLPIIGTCRDKVIELVKQFALDCEIATFIEETKT